MGDKMRNTLFNVERELRVLVRSIFYLNNPDEYGLQPKTCRVQILGIQISVPLWFGQYYLIRSVPLPDNRL